MNRQITSLIEPISNGLNHQTLGNAASQKAATAWSVSTRTVTGESLIIRSAMAADAATLATIGGKGFASVHQAVVPEEDMNSILESAWSEKQMAETIANREIQTLVAEIDHQIVGLTSLNPTYQPSYLRRPTPIELGRFYLHLDWIGYGIGSKLMAQALHQASLAGYGICWLRVWQGNKSAIHFYRRWGFTTISADSYAVGNTFVPVWVMIHTLSSVETSNNGKEASSAAAAIIVKNRVVPKHTSATTP